MFLETIEVVAQTLKQFFDPYYDASLEAWEGFAKFLEEKSFQKYEVLKEAHSSESHLHIIVEGSAGMFAYKEGHDTCIDLCFAGEFTGDYFSLLQQQRPNQLLSSNGDIDFLLKAKSPIYVMALEKMKTLAISKQDLFHIYRNSEIGRTLAGMVAELLFMEKQNQQIELLTLTAEQRYQRLLQRKPDILQRTASKHLASYLGVTPEHFSRMRKKIFQ